MISIKTEDGSELIVIKINDIVENINISQALKLRDDLYKAIGIAFANHNIKSEQRRIENIKSGKITYFKKNNEWSEKDVINQSVDENFNTLNSGKKIIL
jgi:hypothetical protein